MARPEVSENKLIKPPGPSVPFQKSMGVCQRPYGFLWTARAQRPASNSRFPVSFLIGYGRDSARKARALETLNYMTFGTSQVNLTFEAPKP